MFKERAFKEGPWEKGGDADNMWMKMATCICKVASEKFAMSRGSGSEAKDTWWWNDGVQKAIKEKKNCFGLLYLDRSADNIEKYKMAKRAAKLMLVKKGVGNMRTSANG